jgi:hypothetical protein
VSLGPEVVTQTRTERGAVCLRVARLWSRIVLPALSLLVLALPQPTMAAGTSASSPCRVSARTSAFPSLVAVGDAINVRYNLVFHCPDNPRPYHLAVAIDRAGIHTGGSADWSAHAFAALPSMLAMSSNPLVRAGVAAAGTLEPCALSADPLRLDSCLAAARAPLLPQESGADSTSLEAALDQAAHLLEQARSDFPTQPSEARPREYLLVLAAAPLSTDCQAPGCDSPAACGGLEATAERVAATGAEIGIVCLSGQCATSCLRRLATSGSYYTRGSWPAALDRQSDLAWSTEVRVAAVTVRDVLASNLALDTTSIDPPEAIYDPGRKLLTWSNYPVRNQGSGSFAYGTIPVRSGAIQVSAYGSGEFLDTTGTYGRFRIDVASVHAADSVLRIFAPFLLRPGGRAIP